MVLPAPMEWKISDAISAIRVSRDGIAGTIRDVHHRNTFEDDSSSAAPRTPRLAVSVEDIPTHFPYDMK